MKPSDIHLAKKITQSPFNPLANTHESRYKTEYRIVNIAKHVQKPRYMTADIRRERGQDDDGRLRGFEGILNSIGEQFTPSE
jgi:hypothetical protein